MAALALGAFAFPRLAADGVPASLKAKPDRTPSLAELKLDDGRCGRKHDFELESDVFERTVGAPT
jgi:hypothetical protein